MSGSKTEKCIELEEGQTPRDERFSPLQELLMPKPIEEASATSLALKGRTVAECLPELSTIAKELNLNLNIGKEWRLAVEEMDRRNLNK